MHIKSQTEVTDVNRARFYQQVYQQQFNNKTQLINLNGISNTCILVDCCGWHYKTLFPESKILCLETLKTALQFKLDRGKFDKLIDDQKHEKINWPQVPAIDPVLIFDRSPILKYRSVDNLVGLLTDAVGKYNAIQLIVNTSTTFIDDVRLVDRFYQLSSICIPNFTVKEFSYKASENKLFLHFHRNYVV